MTITLTPEQFAILSGKLSQAPGLTVSRTSETAGTINEHDVDLGYTYDGGALDIEVLNRKTFMARHAPESMIEGKINELVQENL